MGVTNVNYFLKKSSVPQIYENQDWVQKILHKIRYQTVEVATFINLWDKEIIAIEIWWGWLQNSGVLLLWKMYLYDTKACITIVCNIWHDGNIF